MDGNIHDQVHSSRSVDGPIAWDLKLNTADRLFTLPTLVCRILKTLRCSLYAYYSTRDYREDIFPGTAATAEQDAAYLQPCLGHLFKLLNGVLKDCNCRVPHCMLHADSYDDSFASDLQFTPRPFYVQDGNCMIMTTSPASGDDADLTFCSSKCARVGKWSNVRSLNFLVHDAQLSINPLCMKWIVYTHVSFERACPAVCSTLQTVWLLATRSCPPSAIQWVEVTAYLKQSPTHSEQPERAIQIATCGSSRCHHNDTDVGSVSDEADSLIEDVSSKLKLSVACFHDEAKANFASLRHAVATACTNLRDQLIQLDSTSGFHEAKQCRHQREFEAHASRFMRHEARNDIYAAVADLNAVAENLRAQTSCLEGDIAEAEYVTSGCKSARLCDCESRERRQNWQHSENHKIVTDLERIATNLERTSEALLSRCTVKEIINGTYMPRLENFDLAALCRCVRSKVLLLVTPETFCIASDMRLLRHVIENAVANASQRCEGIVSIDISWSSRTPGSRGGITRIIVRGSNRRGPCAQHDEAVIHEPRYGRVQKDAESSPASRDTLSSREASSGSVDSTWIMQQCARCLGGGCFVRLDDPTALTIRILALFPETDGAEFTGSTAYLSRETVEDTSELTAASPKDDGDIDTSCAVDSGSHEMNWHEAAQGHSNRTSKQQNTLEICNPVSTTNDIIKEPLPFSTDTDKLRALRRVLLSSSSPKDDAKRPSTKSSKGSAHRLKIRATQPEEPFDLPKGTYLIGLDDAPTQRNLLRKYFAHLGARERSHVLGKNETEIESFVDTNFQFVLARAENSESKFVFILDDTLHVVRKDGNGALVASGISLGEKLRSKLAAVSLDSRCLFLVRSARDRHQTQFTTQTLDGDIPKFPMSSVQFSSALGACWNSRFQLP